MSYTLNLTFDFGTLTGLTLNGKLFNSSGVQVGSTITSGFVELGNGNYSYLATIPSGHVGSFIAYKSSDATIDAIVSINPQEDEPGESSIVNTITVTVPSSIAPGTYCGRTDVEDLLSQAGVLATIDDDENGVESPDESQAVVLAIQRSATRINVKVQRQYVLADVTTNTWLRWANATMAAAMLIMRRSNPLPETWAQDLREINEMLDDVAWGRMNLPEQVPSFDYRGSVTNLRPELYKALSPVRVVVPESTGPQSVDGVIKRPVAGQPGLY